MKTLNLTDPLHGYGANSLQTTQWGELISASTSLQCASTRLLAKRIGLSGTETLALLLINALPKLSTGELTFFMSISSGKATQLLDRLERQGWIHRNKAPDDRRVSCLSLAPERVAAFEQAQDDAWAAFFASMPPQGPDELSAMNEDLVHLSTLLRSQK